MASNILEQMCPTSIMSLRTIDSEGKLKHEEQIYDSKF